MLSFDGGGIKGLAELAALQKLELYYIIPQQFQSFVGVSIGSIISLGLVKGYTAQYLISLMQKNIQNVFLTSYLGKTYNLSTNGSYYFNTGLKTLLKTIINQQQILSSVVSNKYWATIACKLQNEIIKSYLFVNRNGVFEIIVDQEGISFLQQQKYRNMKLIDIIMASCAAVPYFPSYIINNQIWVDGGILWNNPSYVMALFLEAINKKPAEILSFGFIQKDKQVLDFEWYNETIEIIKPLLQFAKQPSISKANKLKKSKDLIIKRLDQNIQIINYLVKQIPKTQVQRINLQLNFDLDDIQKQSMKIMIDEGFKTKYKRKTHKNGGLQKYMIQIGANQITLNQGNYNRDYIIQKYDNFMEQNRRKLRKQEIETIQYIIGQTQLFMFMKTDQIIEITENMNEQQVKIANSVSNYISVYVPYLEQEDLKNQLRKQLTQINSLKIQHGVKIMNLIKDVQRLLLTKRGKTWIIQWIRSIDIGFNKRIKQLQNILKNQKQQQQQKERLKKQRIKRQKQQQNQRISKRQKEQLQRIKEIQRKNQEAKLKAKKQNEKRQRQIQKKKIIQKEEMKQQQKEEKEQIQQQKEEQIQQQIQEQEQIEIQQQIIQSNIQMHQYDSNYNKWDIKQIKDYHQWLQGDRSNVQPTTNIPKDRLDQYKQAYDNGIRQLNVISTPKLLAYPAFQTSDTGFLQTIQQTQDRAFLIGKRFIMILKLPYTKAKKMYPPRDNAYQKRRNIEMNQIAAYAILLDFQIEIGDTEYVENVRIKYQIQQEYVQVWVSVGSEIISIYLKQYLKQNLWPSNQVLVGFTKDALGAAGQRQNNDLSYQMFDSWSKNDLIKDQIAFGTTTKTINPNQDIKGSIKFCEVIFSKNAMNYLIKVKEKDQLLHHKLNKMFNKLPFQKQQICQIIKKNNKLGIVWGQFSSYARKKQQQVDQTFEIINGVLKQAFLSFGKTLKTFYDLESFQNIEISIKKLGFQSSQQLKNWTQDPVKFYIKKQTGYFQSVRDWVDKYTSINKHYFVHQKMYQIANLRFQDMVQHQGQWVIPLTLQNRFLVVGKDQQKQHAVFYEGRIVKMYQMLGLKTEIKNKIQAMVILFLRDEKKIVITDQIKKLVKDGVGKI